MSCFYPLKNFLIGKKVNGKSITKVVPYGVDHLEFYNGSWHTSDISMRSSLAEKVCRDWVEIPCGKCVGCRLEYSRRWADRCMIENMYHDKSYFLTLTYDDEHVPRSWYSDPSTGEAFESFTLKKKDLQDFHKRLRFHYTDTLRFYACGEYGSHTFRPHYHSIMYGLDLPDLQPFQRTKLGYQYYTSRWLADIWKNGHVMVGEVNWNTCAYVARYIMKKHLGKDSDFYVQHGLEPEFTLMSRRPGLAHQYYEDHKDELIAGKEIFISTDTGGKKLRTPKYYDAYFELDFPEEFAIIKEDRLHRALVSKSNMLAQTDLDYLSYLDVRADKTERRLQGLVRPVF